MEDDDNAQGVLTLWATIPNISTLVPGGLVYGRQLAGLGVGPYASLNVKQGPTGAQEGWITGGKFIDFRHIEMTIHGIKAAVVTALAAVRAKFDAEVSAGKNTALAVPNTLATIQIRPILSPDSLTQDAVKSQGEDIWIGKAEYEVLTFRQRT